MKLNQKLGPVAIGVVYAVAGLLLLLLPNTSVKTIVFAVAGVSIVVGLFHAVSYLLRKNAKTDGLARGLLFVGAGIYMALRPEQMGTLLPTLLAFVVLSGGCTLLQEALVRYRAKDAQALIVAGMGLAVVVWAVLLLADIFPLGAMLYRMTGIGLAGVGAAQLVMQFKLKANA